MRYLTVLLTLAGLPWLACAPGPQKLPGTVLGGLLQRNPETWALVECDAILKKFAVSNIKGYYENPARSYYSHDLVFIRALPFNRYVVSAMVRKEALQRRFDVARFRRRLREDLESFTNYTVDDRTGMVRKKPGSAGERPGEYSFQVYFENISDPHRTIEVYRAEEGFFLERSDGQFVRVKEISGTGADVYFTLVDDLNWIVTFNAVTDAGRYLAFSPENLPAFKLIFNGLQPKPVVLAWQKF